MASFIAKFLACAIALGGATAAFLANPLRNDILAQSRGMAEPKYAKLVEELDRLTAGNSGEMRLFPVLKGPVAPKVTANFEGGVYDRTFFVTLANPERAPIYYTLDGSTPTKQSLPYDKPLFIDRTTILRFRSFQPGVFPGPTTTYTYVIGSEFSLPVVSLVMDPVSLWNKYSGIYAHPQKRGRKWERAAHVEYFETNDSRPFRFPAEVRIHGNWSREAPKKSFQLTYSTGPLSGQDAAGILNPPKLKKSQSTVVLRAGAMDVSYRLGDELFRSIYAEASGLVSRAAPVMLLLNGEPWGVYNLHEKIDEAYLERRYGEGRYELISQDRRPRPILNDGSRWTELIRFFSAHDMTRDQEFRQAQQMIDIDNFTDHRLFNIYAANLDWPHSNEYAFRKIDKGERWRWISWDADATFGFRDDLGLKHDTLAWATRHDLRHDLSYGGTKSDAEEFLTSTLIVRSLLKNRSYRERFITRFCDLMNSHLRPDRLHARLDEIIGNLAPNLAVDWKKWPGSKEDFFQGVEQIRRFISERPALVFKHFQNHFQLGKLVTVTVHYDPHRGAVQINGMTPDHYPWTGQYFENSRLRLTAVPAPGFEFAGWSDPNLGTESQATVVVHDSLTIEAHYRAQSFATQKPPLPATKRRAARVN
ncbi:MAG: CotH kinase family protein [Candidatus Binatia bacterium]